MTKSHADARNTDARSRGRAARAAAWLALPLGFGAVLVFVALRGGFGTAPAPASRESTSYFVQNDLRVEMTAARAAGSIPADESPGPPVLPAWTNSELRFTVREAAGTGRPITGLRPLAWLVKRAEGVALPERGTGAEKNFIQSLLSSRVTSGADVNLNEYVVITLDDNPSLSIIDPQVDSSKTKVIGMISLPSRGADFVLTPDRRKILVTLPDSREVAIAHISKRIASHVEVEGAPYRIAFQPDNRFVWVGDRAGRTVTAIDAATLTVAARVDVMPGPHEFAFREDSGVVFVSSAASTRVAAIDVRSMKVERSIDLEAPVTGVSYSAHGRRAFAALATGAVVGIDGERLEPGPKIELPDGSSGFAMSPDGRFGFVLNAVRDQVTIVDAATGRPAYTILTEKAPDRIDFTSSFAYVRHAKSELMVLIELASIGEANVPITSTVVLGRKPPTEGGFSAIAPLLAPLPEGGGALVLNPADRSVYHFVEGMNAPMGEYPSYPWTARGILIVDRTIREIDEGVYLSEFQSPRPGSYTVAFLVPSSPQLYGCLDLTVERGDAPGPDEATLAMEPLFASETFPPNEKSRVVVRLTEKATGQPASRLRDVMVIVTRGPVFQWRGPAMPLGDGRYEVVVPFEDAGQYAVFVGCASRGVRPGALPSRYANVASPNETVQTVETPKERS